jgi:hypothetical protein
MLAFTLRIFYMLKKIKLSVSHILESALPLGYIYNPCFMYFDALLLGAYLFVIVI